MPNKERKIDYKEEAERLSLQKNCLFETAKWWEKEIKKTVARLEYLVDNSSYSTEEEEEFLEKHKMNLMKKAEWEMKEQQKFENKEQKFIFSNIANKISKSLGQ